MSIISSHDKQMLLVWYKLPGVRQKQGTTDIISVLLSAVSSQYFGRYTGRYIGRYIGH